MARDLIVVGFSGIHRASEVLNQLQRLNDQSMIDLSDAVAAYRTDDGSLRVDQSVQMTMGQGAGWGALLGVLLGAAVAAPFTGGLSAAAAATTLGVGAASGGALGTSLGAAEASDEKDTYGISEDFVTEVGGMIQPGDSAVFALLRSPNPDVVAERFRGYGGKILKTSLSADQAQRIERTLRNEARP